MPLRLIAILLLFLAGPATAGTLLVVGDSLSAGYGLPRGSDWVTLLSKRLVADGHEVRVVNASISGETTAGGKRRIQRLLDLHQPAVAVIELGANDGLRGIHLPLIRANLTDIVRTSREAGARVLVVGMRIPPNYGREYAEKFHALFGEVAQQHNVSLLPFLLDGFADDRAMFQDDGIHPAAKAQPLIAENVYQRLKPLLD